MFAIAAAAAAACVATAAAAPADGYGAPPAPGYRLIEFTPGYAIWMLPEELEPYSDRMLPFMDITDHRAPVRATPARRFALPGEPTRQAEVAALNARIDGDEIFGVMAELEEFFTRYYTSEEGVAAALRIADIFANITAAAGRDDDVQITVFEHDFPQPSVLVRLEGQLEEAVILSSHLDTHTPRRSPGADDNASGVAEAIHAFRTFLELGERPLRSLEFHCYAAEETGLRGATDVAAAYAAADIPVVAVLNLDMVAYASPSREIGLFQDLTDPVLNDLVGKLIDEYLDIGWVPSGCGGGCSDHAAWTREGFVASFPFETEFQLINPNYHSVDDTVANSDKAHAIEFAKLANAFLYEVGFFEGA